MAESRLRLRFTGEMHIRHSRDFERLRAVGGRLVRGCLVANWMVLPEGSSCRAGFITSRRIGNAVIRNRARRLLRESFRLHQHELKHPVDLVLIARPSIAGKPFQDVERDFLDAMGRARLLVQPENK